MANNPRVDLNESSVYADDKSGPTANSPDDATDTVLDRLEAITGGAEEPILPDDDLAKQFDQLAATTEEELDALKINLAQEDERPNSRDGSGLVIDDAAEERIARFTEADPRESDVGAIRVEPGREDPSVTLRGHHPNTSIARSEAVVEGNLDEPMDESVGERKVDDGTAG